MLRKDRGIGRRRWSGPTKFDTSQILRAGPFFYKIRIVCTCSTLCRAVTSSVLLFSQRFWGYSIYFMEGFWLVKSSIYQTIWPIKKPAISLAFRKYFRYELQYWSPADKSGLEIYSVSLYCKHICLSRNILGPNVLQYDAILKKGPMNLNWVQQCRLPFPITLSCTSMIFGVTDWQTWEGNSGRLGRRTIKNEL